MAKPKEDFRYKGVKQDYLGRAVKEKPKAPKVERVSVRSKAREKIANVWTKGDALALLDELARGLRSKGNPKQADKVTVFSVSIQERFKDLGTESEIDSSGFDAELNAFVLPYLYELELEPIRKKKAISKRNKKDYADKKTWAYSERQFLKACKQIYGRENDFQVEELEGGGVAVSFSVPVEKLEQITKRANPNTARGKVVKAAQARLAKFAAGEWEFKCDNPAHIHPPIIIQKPNTQTKQ